MCVSDLLNKYNILYYIYIIVIESIVQFRFTFFYNICMKLMC